MSIEELIREDRRAVAESVPLRHGRGVDAVAGARRMPRTTSILAPAALLVALVTVGLLLSGRNATPVDVVEAPTPSIDVDAQPVDGDFMVLTEFGVEFHDYQSLVGTDPAVAVVDDLARAEQLTASERRVVEALADVGEVFSIMGHRAEGAVIVELLDPSGLTASISTQAAVLPTDAEPVVLAGYDAFRVSTAGGQLYSVEVRGYWLNIFVMPSDPSMAPTPAELDGLAEAIVRTAAVPMAELAGHLTEASEQPDTTVAVAVGDAQLSPEEAAVLEAVAPGRKVVEAVHTPEVDGVPIDHHMVTVEWSDDEHLVLMWQRIDWPTSNRDRRGEGSFFLHADGVGGSLLDHGWRLTSSAFGMDHQAWATIQDADFGGDEVPTTHREVAALARATLAAIEPGLVDPDSVTPETFHEGFADTLLALPELQGYSLVESWGRDQGGADWSRILVTGEKGILSLAYQAAYPGDLIGPDHDYGDPEVIHRPGPSPTVVVNHPTGATLIVEVTEPGPAGPPRPEELEALALATFKAANAAFQPVEAPPGGSSGG